MDPRFNDIFSKPENQIFDIVFFPDRIYHAQYLNATRSNRYRYNVTEVRNKLDIAILKGEVYMYGSLLTNFIRIEYRASRLIELVREKSRFIQDTLLAYFRWCLPIPRRLRMRQSNCIFVRGFARTRLRSGAPWSRHRGCLTTLKCCR